MVDLSCGEITEPVEFHGGQVTCGEAAHVGWTALREVFRTWNVHEMGDLTTWLRSNGFAAVQPGNHISARAQEHILTQACAFDARVALLESAYVALTLHRGRQMCVIPPPVQPPCQERPQPHHESWACLDDINLENFFDERIPMLKSCPHFLRGRLRFSALFLSLSLSLSLFCTP